ncbi:MAG TPA: hypothetical protein PKV41_04210, partial [Candidatus Omnitrophota bacterium]|nr:hypothetical protein [Candidatus Omnitrophota bacterium]
MKVSNLANDLKTTSDEVLKVLRSLKLKAKDSEQELSAAVVSVIKSEIKAAQKAAASKTITKARKVDAGEPSGKKAKKTPPTETKIPKKTVKAKAALETPTVKTTEEISKKKVPSKETKSKTVVSKPVRTTGKGVLVKKTTVIKKMPVGDDAKLHPKISQAPVITLKPLVRKRKKTSPTGKEEAFEERKEEVKTAASLPSAILSPEAGLKEAPTVTDVGGKAIRD